MCVCVCEYMYVFNLNGDGATQLYIHSVAAIGNIDGVLSSVCPYARLASTTAVRLCGAQLQLSTIL